ncbi:translation initiation factor IF-2 N-terminal domain-containing protein [Rhodococcus sp. IEGM 1409]|uniref:translation initiation factor IF-2 N-terminal domain-containing protein n=1 Tax=Rhodococcus sp. IEGM 1409 TaxID=3047082 RepID=UPI0024B65277|nr:translation initiation factor IF-2 N-terminal domain-containing protein [Rhodococcus sp. IEGM 1409]MDI9900269.1 translation initiation factor IF-2 N-terminal domain-containing protein [Rhodococcus sp. IEGM 1409]
MDALVAIGMARMAASRSSAISLLLEEERAQLLQVQALVVSVHSLALTVESAAREGGTQYPASGTCSLAGLAAAVVASLAVPPVGASQAKAFPQRGITESDGAHGGRFSALGAVEVELLRPHLALLGLEVSPLAVVAAAMGMWRPAMAGMVASRSLNTFMTMKGSGYVSKIAKVLVDDYKGAPGRARLFRLSETLDGYDEVLIWLQDSIGPMGPEVNVVGTNLITGKPKLGFPLPGSCKLQHMVEFEDACSWALATAGGYTMEPADLKPEPDEVSFSRDLRVYEVAYKLDVPSARVIEALEALGIEGKTPSSNVGPADAVRVRDYLSEATDG